MLKQPAYRPQAADSDDEEDVTIQKRYSDSDDVGGNRSYSMTIQKRTT